MHGTRRTGTFFLGVVVEAAGAGVHSRYQHKAGREVDGYLGPADGNPPFFHRLAHNFQYAAFELGQFIEEQYTIMGQRNFTGLGYTTATHQRYITGSMMGRPEWPFGNQRGMGR
jgi:hypothetical protein